ncbi:hypothetical protein N1851_007807 [Merluccius polli]|uniref:Uncharacterized protein n=1 Tax=Merluccius polli TaxID=89951 RepID=A0AA47N3P2_MERPO|nr:hypothetical protein N1851_007807 [Merluccius polli]
MKAADGRDDLEDITEQIVKIYVKKGATDRDSPEDVGIIIEGVQVMTGLGNVARASSILLGLIYAPNLSYPKGLRFTFETFQKLFLELDGSKLSSKSLKNKLVA